MSRERIGIYGLGTMGSALALNFAEKGFDVAVSNREKEWIAPFIEQAGDLAPRLHPHEDLKALAAALERPRIILFMIPSGAPMDAMIDEILPFLETGDVLIDGGNADFNDTRRRALHLAGQGIEYVGMGVSGGKIGARHGPSMMLGGSEQSWTLLSPFLSAIAARHEGSACVARVGPDGAGHFVKTVHNGIEYADMQIIAEIYGLLRYGADLSVPKIAGIFAEWDRGPLKSYLVEITARVLGYADPRTGKPVLEVILDSAGQKGTGRWTVIEALRLGQSASIIEAAMGARAWSAEKETRESAERILGGMRSPVTLGPEQLGEALLAARLLAFAQGFRILAAASQDHDWGLDSAEIARIWRAGCIIRTVLLDTIADAFAARPPHDQLILSPEPARILARCLPALREVVAQAVTSGHPVPALSAALQWLDTMRQSRGSAGLIQAQRDFFGYHGFARLDEPGVHHGPWWD